VDFGLRCKWKARLPGFIPNVVAIETFDTNQSKTTRALVTYLQNLKGLKYKADFGIDRLLLEQKGVL
jgi:hypothetical protein